MNEIAAQKDAIEYVELEADTEVTEINLQRRFSHWGHEQYVFIVKTTDPIREWWVVAGDTPSNLYPKNQFSDPDDVFSFHAGIMDRLHEEETMETSETVGDKKYDVFICHASEDKGAFVEPLAHELDRMGLYVWYDEFELNIGDSLRESIDEGLSESHFGVVVLSKAFFEKDWPQYELNGLTAREIDGDTVILPIWYQVDRSDIMEYSPPLADKIAIIADGSEIDETARELVEGIESILQDRITNQADFFGQSE